MKVFVIESVWSVSGVTCPDPAGGESSDVAG